MTTTVLSWYVGKNLAPEELKQIITNKEFADKPIILTTNLGIIAKAPVSTRTCENCGTEFLRADADLLTAQHKEDLKKILSQLLNTTDEKTITEEHNRLLKMVIKDSVDKRIGSKNICTKCADL